MSKIKLIQNDQNVHQISKLAGNNISTLADPCWLLDGWVSKKRKSSWLLTKIMTIPKKTKQLTFSPGFVKCNVVSDFPDAAGDNDGITIAMLLYLMSTYYFWKTPSKRNSNPWHFAVSRTLWQRHTLLSISLKKLLKAKLSIQWLSRSHLTVYLDQ